MCGFSGFRSSFGTCFCAVLCSWIFGFYITFWHVFFSSVGVGGFENRYFFGVFFFRVFSVFSVFSVFQKKTKKDEKKRGGFSGGAKKASKNRKPVFGEF